MLDKQFCKQWNVDAFLEYLVNKIDTIQDTIESKSVSAEEAKKLSAKVEGLIEVRDVYCSIKDANKQEAR